MDFNKEYDKMCKICLTNIWSLSKETGNIVLTNFNTKRKDHLCVLNIAEMASSMFHFPITIELNWFNSLKTKRLTNISFYHKRKLKNKQNVIDVQSLLDFMENSNSNNGIFEKIYVEYYERKN